MGRQGQMEISLQQSTQEIGNDLRKKKKTPVSKVYTLVWLW
jgi:hypothetical protein